VTVNRAGEALPAQVEQELSSLNLDWRKRVVFAAELAPSQMNRFDCTLHRLSERPVKPVAAASGFLEFANETLVVRINTATGLIDRYCVDGVDYLRPAAFTPLVICDNEDPWGMTVQSFREVVGEFRLMPPQSGTVYSGVTRTLLPSVRIVEDGAVRTVVEAVLGYGASAITLRYAIPRRGAEVGIKARVHWNEKDRMLKLSLPIYLEDARFVGQVAYGRQELLTNGNEMVAQQWVAVANETHALTCINDGTYGSDFCDGELRLSLLRSPAYSGHPIGARDIVPQDRYTPRIDQGERLFHFWLNAGAQKERLASVDREALVNNQPPFALSFFPHGAGQLPLPGVLLSDPAVVLTAFKQSEDGKAFILRLFEPTGAARRTAVSLPAWRLEYEVTLRPFEIKTLRLDLGSYSVTEVDLMESAVE
jgi:alpha-mannosidase